MDKYITVLENDESNAFGSLGVANVLAEHGKIAEAMEVYKVLKETNPNIPHPLLNLAHMNVAEGNYEAAINLYRKALEKYPDGRDLETELYLAKAHYKA
jgi:RNA polymerase-associated protein CTR9